MGVVILDARLYAGTYEYQVQGKFERAFFGDVFCS
jgi:hypothetical protein